MVNHGAQTELLDAFTEKETPELFAPDPAAEQQIGFRNATFAWSKESDGSLTRSQRQFLLKIEGELLFQPGRINLVVGPTGSGEVAVIILKRRDPHSEYHRQDLASHGVVGYVYFYL